MIKGKCNYCNEEFKKRSGNIHYCNKRKCASKHFYKKAEPPKHP